MADERPLPRVPAPPISGGWASPLQFFPLEKWRLPHAGLFWSAIKDQYPNTEVQTPLQEQTEKYGEEFWVTPGVQIQVLNPDVTRFWFLDKENLNLIQIQRDRFIVNWRKLDSGKDYPQYEKTLRPRLQKEWSAFKAFLKEQNIDEPRVNQCEVTYVNDIPIGQEPDAFGKSLDLFSSVVEQGDRWVFVITRDASALGFLPDG